MSQSKFQLVYCTVRDKEEARTIAWALLEERYVACVNLVNPIESIYWWKGQLEESSECLLVAKTRTELIPEVIQVIKEEHSYEQPCIVTLPIEQGEKGFLEWIYKETEIENVQGEEIP